jgi:hypothetical protein
MPEDMEARFILPGDELSAVQQLRIIFAPCTDTLLCSFFVFRAPMTITPGYSSPTSPVLLSCGLFAIVCSFALELHALPHSRKTHFVIGYSIILVVTLVTVSLYFISTTRWVFCSGLALVLNRSGYLGGHQL